MAFRHPEEIQQDQFCFSGVQTHATPDHLLIQAAHLRRAENDNAVHCRAIPALREQHAVAQNGVSALFKIPEDIGAIRAVSVDLGGGNAHFVQEAAKSL